MHKSVFLLITILWSILPSTYAQQRSYNTLKRIAQEKLSKGEVSLLDNQDGICVYGNDQGFVIMSRHGEGKAVIGYSHTKYDKSRLPEGLKWWMNVAKKNIQVQDGKLEPTSKRASFTTVEPFIKSTWDQDEPYYYLCPKDNGENCMTGCVATALAQVLYYYQYPESAEGSGSYYIGETKYEKAINTTYDWANMKDSYLKTELQFSNPVKAVAALMRDCGYATNMQYSSEGSGTSDSYMALALRNNFKYDSLAIKYYDRAYYSDEEWKGMVYSSLANKMPVMYAGVNEEGTSAHEFLLCGVDTDGLVYVNWGWGGSGDGFFDLDMLKYFSYEFNHQQSMVTGTRPQQTPDSEDKFESLWIADDIDYSVKDEDVIQMDMLYMFNYSVLEFKGTIDLVLQNKADASDVTYLSFLNTDDTNVGSIQPFYGYYFIDEETEKQEPVYMEGFKSLAPGIYRMYLTCKEKRDSQRQLIRNSGGTQYATLKKLSDGTLLVSNKDVDDIDTGILSVYDSPKDKTAKALYNLKGQKVSSAKERRLKGIYVVNGKKIMM